MVTFEHIPPKSAGNAEPVTATQVLGEEAFAEWRDGVAFRTLCSGCQQRGSHWFVKEYGAWVAAVIDAGRRHCKRERRYSPVRFQHGELIPVTLAYDRSPGRFARAVIGMFLAAQSDAVLVQTCPELIEAVRGQGDGEKKPPAPFELRQCSLHMGMAVDDAQLTTSAVWELGIALSGRTPGGLHVLGGYATTTDTRLLRVPPFAFTLVIGRDRPDVERGIDISAWTERDHNYRVRKADRELQLPMLNASVHPSSAT